MNKQTDCAPFHAFNRRMTCRVKFGSVAFIVFFSNILCPGAAFCLTFFSRLPCLCAAPGRPDHEDTTKHPRRPVRLQGEECSSMFSKAPAFEDNQKEFQLVALPNEVFPARPSSKKPRSRVQFPSLSTTYHPRGYRLPRVLGNSPPTQLKGS